jgi:hypothetical protein
MAVYHCPLCPLIFTYRTEVEWHMRQEHRSRADEEDELRDELAAALAALDRDRLDALRSLTGDLSVSLLLATTPAGSMTVVDIARLRQLADRAARRLFAEPHSDGSAPAVQHRLSRLVAVAEGSPADHGLAVFVNSRHMAIYRLPFGPRDRGIVDRAFATRDLEYALQHFPKVRVVALGRSARILEGRGRDLVEVDGGDLPRSLLGGGPGDTEHEHVDGLLDQRVRVSGALPLFIVGDRRRRAVFRQRSRYGDSIAQEAHRARRSTTPVETVIRRALHRWQQEEQGRRLSALHQASARDQLRWGLRETWQAVAERTAERVWVEHDFARPGRLTPGVDGVEITGDPAEPGAIDDVVDELIAIAQRRGIRVDLLEPGTLGRSEPIAAQVPTAQETDRPGASNRSQPEVAAVSTGGWVPPGAFLRSLSPSRSRRGVASRGG